MTPCIFFCFSRKKCEQHAKSVPQSLLDQNEISELRKIVYFNLKKCDQFDSYIKLQQYDHLMKCLEKGVAYHHSGLLPVFKEIVEILYGKHLVKVLFATETFAVGVNMPTKTVVFTSIEKFSGNDFRYLYTHEYLQMGGRAGRRGIDKEGSVILLPNIHELPTSHVMNNLINGNSQTIQSKFTPDYQLILKVMLTNSSIDNIVNKSLLTQEVDNQTENIKKQLSEITLPDKDFNICEEYDSLLNTNTGDSMIKISQSVIKKNRKRANKIKYSEGFEDLYKEYSTYKPIIEKYNKLQNQLKNSGNYLMSEIKDVCCLLKEHDYISSTNSLSKESVTIKGIIASEINECNEILMTELIYSGILNEITYKDLGAVLAVFADSKPVKSNNEGNHTDAYKPYQYIKYIDKLEETANIWSKKENDKRLTINSEWDINTYLMEATYKWLDNSPFEAITQEYGLFEGNLIKDFIKIYNLSAEVEKVAEILNISHLQIEAKKVRDHIVRDIVNIESLYIK